MEDLKWSSVFFIIISNNFMEEKCVCSVQIWKEVFDHFDRQPKKIEINENYSIDDDAKETLQEKRLTSFPNFMFHSEPLSIHSLIRG